MTQSPFVFLDISKTEKYKNGIKKIFKVSNVPVLLKYATFPFGSSDNKETENLFVFLSKSKLNQPKMAKQPLGILRTSDLGTSALEIGNKGKGSE